MESKERKERIQVLEKRLASMQKMVENPASMDDPKIAGEMESIKAKLQSGKEELERLKAEEAEDEGKAKEAESKKNAEKAEKTKAVKEKVAKKKSHREKAEKKLGITKKEKKSKETQSEAEGKVDKKGKLVAPGLVMHEMKKGEYYSIKKKKDNKIYWDIIKLSDGKYEVTCLTKEKQKFPTLQAAIKHIVSTLSKGVYKEKIAQAKKAKKYREKIKRHPIKPARSVKKAAKAVEKKTESKKTKPTEFRTSIESASEIVGSIISNIQTPEQKKEAERGLKKLQFIIGKMLKRVSKMKIKKMEDGGVVEGAEKFMEEFDEPIAEYFEEIEYKKGGKVVTKKGKVKKGAIRKKPNGKWGIYSKEKKAFMPQEFKSKKAANEMLQAMFAKMEMADGGSVMDGKMDVKGMNVNQIFSFLKQNPKAMEGVKDFLMKNPQLLAGI